MGLKKMLEVFSKTTLEVGEHLISDLKTPLCVFEHGARKDKPSGQHTRLNFVIDDKVVDKPLATDLDSIQNLINELSVRQFDFL